MLCGGTARLKNLPDFLLGELEGAGITSVQLANPWANLSQVKNPALNEIETLGFVTAIGLAKRGMEFQVR